MPSRQKRVVIPDISFHQLRKIYNIIIVVAIIVLHGFEGGVQVSGTVPIMVFRNCDNVNGTVKSLEQRQDCMQLPNGVCGLGAVA